MEEEVVGEEEVIVIKTFEERITELEVKLDAIDKAVGAVVVFLREHDHDKAGTPYVPERL